MRQARTSRVRVMPWSHDASVPGYGVDVVARQRIAQRSHEPIPYTVARIALRLDEYRVEGSVKDRPLGRRNQGLRQHCHDPVHLRK